MAYYTCTHIVSLAIINLLSLLNTRVKTNYRKYKACSTIYEQTHFCILEARQKHPWYKKVGPSQKHQLALIHTFDKNSDIWWRPMPN